MGLENGGNLRLPSAPPRRIGFMTSMMDFQYGMAARAVLCKLGMMSKWTTALSLDSAGVSRLLAGKARSDDADSCATLYKAPCTNVIVSFVRGVLARFHGR